MSDEAFIRAIQAKPLDMAYRLVYADYLDEQDDPRGAFLRCTCELDTPNRPTADVIRTHQQLDALEPKIDAAWVTQVLANRVWLRYHRHTFALLGETPVLDAKSVKLMDAWEKKHKRKLPVALREWYSIEDGEKRLPIYNAVFEPGSLADQLHSLQQRHHPRLTWNLGFWPDYDLGYHVPLDAGDDPPVTTDADYVELRLPTFSATIFSLVWVNVIGVEDVRWLNSNYHQPTTPANDFPLLIITGTMLSLRGLRYLQASFVEHGSHCTSGKTYTIRNPFTRQESAVWGPPSELRFYAPGVAIKVTCKGDPRKRAKECYWEIASRSADTLYEVVAASLWKYGDLAAHMSSPTKSGKKLLQRLQKLK